MKTAFTSHPSSDREKKNLLFLNLIKKHKSTSRTEISKLTGINIVSVSNYVTGYLKKGLVIERGYDVSSGGRRPELVELNKKWGCALGIDIGEDCVRGVLVDLDMQTLASEFIGHKKENLKSVTEEIIQRLLNASSANKTQVKKIGLVVSRDNIEEDINEIKSAITKKIEIPILVGDATLCAAFGEQTLNKEVIEISSILYIYKDLGEGVFIKDDEFYGATDEKDEYAYLKPWGEKLGIVSEVKEIVAQGVGTNIVDIANGNIENITLDTVIKAAQNNDEVAIELLKMVGMNLGVRIAYLINSLKPEAVVVGGGIEKAGKLFLEPLTSSINRFMLHNMLNKVKLTPAILKEEARVKGGAFLAIREAFIET